MSLRGQRDITLSVMPYEDLVNLRDRFVELHRLARHVGASETVIAQWVDELRSIEDELEFRRDEPEVPF